MNVDVSTSACSSFPQQLFHTSESRSHFKTLQTLPFLLFVCSVSLSVAFLFRPREKKNKASLRRRVSGFFAHSRATMWLVTQRIQTIEPPPVSLHVCAEKQGLLIIMYLQLSYFLIIRQGFLFRRCVMRLFFPFQPCTPVILERAR